MSKEGTKDTKPIVAIMKNAGLAPVVFFDNAPACGVFGGNVEVELSARTLIPRSDNSVIPEVICTAHLRCNPQAAVALRDALDRALAMLSENGKKQS